MQFGQVSHHVCVITLWGKLVSCIQLYTCFFCFFWFPFEIQHQLRLYYQFVRTCSNGWGKWSACLFIRQAISGHRTQMCLGVKEASHWSFRDSSSRSFAVHIPKIPTSGFLQFRNVNGTHMFTPDSWTWWFSIFCEELWKINLKLCLSRHTAYIMDVLYSINITLYKTNRIVPLVSLQDTVNSAFTKLSYSISYLLATACLCRSGRFVNPQSIS